MSRRSFTTSGAIPANMNGIELTEAGFAVDRFYHPDDGAAAFLADNVDTLIGLTQITNITRTGNTVTISGASSPTITNTYNIVDRTVILDGAGASLTSGINGVHINLINCQVDIRNGATGANIAIGSWPSAGDQTARVSETFTDIANPTAAQLATARTNSRSLNLYGCSVNISDGTNSRFFSPSDMFDCELDWTSDSAINGALFGTTTNGRWVRFAFRKVVDANTSGNAARTNPYGALRQLGAPVFDGYGIRQGNSGYNTTLIVDEPNFPNSRQAAFYNMNVVGTDTDQPIQVIGGPSLGSVDDAWGNLNGGANPGLISQAADATQSRSGVLTTIADKRRFFSDPLFTTGAEGVILRTRTNVQPSVFGATGDWATRAQILAGRTPTANRDVIVDYTTNADGIWSAFRYSTDGGASYISGSIDWFFWDPRNNAGSTNLATAWSNNSAPAGTVLLPAQNTYGIVNSNNAGSKVLTGYSNETEIRSAVWDVVEASDVYTLPAAGQPLRVNSGNSVVVRDTFFTAADIAAAETPFATASNKTFQDLFNKAKRDYALWDLDTRPGTANGDLNWTGGITITDNDANTVLTGTDITFNRVSELDNSAADNPINGIEITGTLSIEVPFEGRLSANTLNANNQSTGVATLTTPTINNWSVTSTHGSTTVNGATTVGLTNASGTILSSVIFGDNEPAGTGDITLNADAAITVQVQDTSNTRFQAGTNVTIQNVPAQAANYTFTSGTLAGRWAVRNTTKNLTLTSGVVVAGTAETFTVSNSNTGSIEPGDLIRLYYKPTNTATDGYITNVVDYTVPTITADTTQSVTPVRLDDLLYVTPAEATYPGATVAITVNGTGITTTLTGATASGDNLTGSNSQNLLLMGTDMEIYFNQMVAQERTVDFIRAGVESTVLDNVRLASSSGTIQQALQAVSGTFTIASLATYAGVPSVTIVPNPLGISGDAVRNALDTAPSMIQVRRGVGYTIDSVFVSAPNSNGPYDNSGTYGDDL